MSDRLDAIHRLRDRGVTAPLHTLQRLSTDALAEQADLLDAAYDDGVAAERARVAAWLDQHGFPGMAADVRAGVPFQPGATPTSAGAR